MQGCESNPNFKKDDPLLCQNYRLISLLPIYSKILEKILYSRMYSFLEKNQLLNPNQFGFRHDHSTAHALINLTENIKRHLDDKKCVAGVFIDLEKAVDTVNHQILCNKLKHGFRGKINNLIGSFLSDRKQFVCINGYDSTILPIQFGVPQSLTLGTLLFLLYINDLRYCLEFTAASHLRMTPV